MSSNINPLQRQYGMSDLNEKPDKLETEMLKTLSFLRKEAIELSKKLELKERIEALNKRFREEGLL